MAKPKTDEQGTILKYQVCVMITGEGGGEVRYKPTVEKLIKQMCGADEEHVYEEQPEVGCWIVPLPEEIADRLEENGYIEENVIMDDMEFQIVAEMP